MKQTLPSCLNRQMTTRLVLITLVFLGLGQIRSYAQNIYHYTNNSGGVPNYVDPNADDVLPNLSRGGGVSNMNLGCTGGTQGFGSTGWPTTNVFDVNVFNGAGDFVEFTLDPDPGFGLKITGFSTRSRRENVTGTANDGPNAMRYGYSINGGPWTTVNPGNPQSNNLCNSGGVLRVWPGWVTVHTGNPIKFRIYGLSSGSSGTGDLFLRDVIVQGEVCADITLDPIPSLCFANIEQSANMDYAAAVLGNQVEVNFVSPNISDLPLTTLTDSTGSFSFDVLPGTPAGVYLGTLTVSNSCGFEIDYPISVTVNALPNVSVYFSTSEICAGEEVTLTFEDHGATGHTFHLTADLVDDNGTSMGEIDYTGVSDGASIVYTEGVDFDGDENGTVSLVNILVVDETTVCENTSTASSVSLNVYDAPAFEFSATSGVDSGIGNNTEGPITLDIDFCAGDHLTLGDYDDNGNIGYTVSFTSTGNTTYDGGAIPGMSGPTNVDPDDATTFFGFMYGGALGYGLSSGTLGTINQVFVPYLDVDNSGTLTPGDCEGDPMYLNYYIHAIPTVVATPSAAAVCNGATVNIAFTGNYPSNEVTYAWTNDNLTVGLAQGSGTGNISFIATNNTNAPIVANLSVTPSTDYCEGETVYFTVTVYPEPVVSNITATVSGGSPQSANNVNGPNTMTLNFCSGQSF